MCSGAKEAPSPDADTHELKSCKTNVTNSDRLIRINAIGWAFFLFKPHFRFSCLPNTFFTAVFCPFKWLDTV